MNIPEKYLNGEYLEKNPTWDVEDSPWKAEQIQKIIERNNLSPDSICEIGCGAGEILNQLHKKIGGHCSFTGYEISPQAHKICLEKESENLKFKLKDFTTENDVNFDMLLLIDIIEHIEDYFSFLKKIKDKSKYKILHIPLEFFAVSAVYQSFIMNQRKNVGHLHYFSKETVIQTLKELDYEIIDYFYTPGFSLGHDYGLKDRLINIPRKYLYPLNNDLTVRIFGGYSLMILVK
ncbi:class I SAM-dependent methyltransferase [Methanoplanus endosymbiosus]|uniref:Class I SAM-dependent methyltransferase n=1 Tax=Methanoplanus endosymbiosus TaxID=33865 RepID=A0A9E7PMM4_9EURY|nr:class I SAM-dependent methyltransferase [Methanoplanus endosymbiosus]UUX91691.1 class I SAM-dependent methyltransferase [Methanoplanus endosymbiosus]